MTLTGTSRSTGQLSQVRTSFMPSEIFWGHRFANIVSYDRENEIYIVNYDKFNVTIPIETTPFSARRLAETQDESQNRQNKDV